IPRNSRTLYIHAVQSLIWNKVVSYRLKTFGDEIFVGDLIMDVNKKQYSILKEDIDKYTLNDIYIPIIGQYSKNFSVEMATIFNEEIKSLEVSKDELIEYMKKNNFNGSIRKMIVTPDSLEHLFSNDGHYLKMCFNLNPSCYATEFLHELSGGQAEQMINVNSE
ncbi:MAG: multisubstrate pseudouridine synthase 7, partial [Paramarteilia canceri]